VKRRILFITPSLNLPADSSQLRILAAGLADQQYDVHVAAICDPFGSTNGIAGATVHSLGIGRPQSTHRAPHDAANLAAAIRNLLVSLRPDIVHSWDADARSEIAWASRHFRSAQRIETICSVGRSHNFLRQMIRNQISPHEQSVVVPHESLIGHLVDAGCPEEQISVIPLAVSCDSKHGPTEAKEKLTDYLGLPNSSYLATTFAPLQPRFRLKDLIWAADLLTCIRNDFHLLIVGRGEQKKRLRKFASQTEAGSHVHILDKPPEATPSRSTITMADFFLGSDVYWNSSLNTPLASPMLHSMAAGTPVISVLGNGTSDLIRHQETGFAVNFGARDEFARWTKFLIEQTAPADQLCSQGKCYATNNFPAKVVVDAYTCLYENRLSGSV